MNYTFKQAKISDLNAIWKILQQAIIRRKEEGSSQWQDGYPNPDVIEKDIERGAGFVLMDQDVIVGYVAIHVNDEPAYENIEGQWLTDGDFVVFHRVALSQDYVGKGLARRIMGFVEDYAVKNAINSVKADTNFDNIAMMKTFEKLGYLYCGEVYFRGSPRRAYEKILT
ncbi:GNAT family N-acetyltransferase [Sphingobacterium shayense]|uniref:GNAT family N-acetyltransferase n=1 Tax=Sphingobacterium shayense TaxID=626343 RepID=UPI001555AC59|nr:GNAT family N-acetyltransferase [Sphingobacterium shayense]NQD69333.1 GNAT family N-acetyltransferase [Sphingobacterium shayense]